MTKTVEATFKADSVTISAEALYWISEAILRADQFVDATRETGELTPKQLAADIFYKQAKINIKAKV